MANDDYVDNSNRTLPDYQNFRNILFQQWQELNNAYVELLCCSSTDYNTYRKEFIRRFLKFYGQIEHGNKLNHLKKDQKDYLKLYHKKYTKINKKIAKKIKTYTRELMESYGVFDIGYGGEDEIW